jgi:hypothetical protein
MDWDKLFRQLRQSMITHGRCPLNFIYSLIKKDGFEAEFGLFKRMVDMGLTEHMPEGMEREERLLEALSLGLDPESTTRVITHVRDSVRTKGDTPHKLLAVLRSEFPAEFKKVMGEMEDMAADMEDLGF